MMSLIDSNTKKTEEAKHITKEDVLRDEDVDYQVGDYVSPRTLWSRKSHRSY